MIGIILFFNHIVHGFDSCANLRRTDSLEQSQRQHAYWREPHALSNFILDGELDCAEEDVARYSVIFHFPKQAIEYGKWTKPNIAGLIC
jgi:hypothetical protein